MLSTSSMTRAVLPYNRFDKSNVETVVSVKIMVFDWLIRAPEKVAGVRIHKILQTLHLSLQFSCKCVSLGQIHLKIEQNYLLICWQ